MIRPRPTAISVTQNDIYFHLQNVMLARAWRASERQDVPLPGQTDRVPADPASLGSYALSVPLGTHEITSNASLVAASNGHDYSHLAQAGPASISAQLPSNIVRRPSRHGSSAYSFDIETTLAADPDVGDFMARLARMERPDPGRNDRERSLSPVTSSLGRMSIDSPTTQNGDDGATTTNERNPLFTGATRTLEGDPITGRSMFTRSQNQPSSPRSPDSPRSRLSTTRLPVSTTRRTSLLRFYQTADSAAGADPFTGPAPRSSSISRNNSANLSTTNHLSNDIACLCTTGMDANGIGVNNSFHRTDCPACFHSSSRSTHGPNLLYENRPRPMVPIQSSTPSATLTYSGKEEESSGESTIEDLVRYQTRLSTPSLDLITSLPPSPSAFNAMSPQAMDDEEEAARDLYVAPLEYITAEGTDQRSDTRPPTEFPVPPPPPTSRQSPSQGPHTDNGNGPSTPTSSRELSITRPARHGPSPLRQTQVQEPSDLDTLSTPPSNGGAPGARRTVQFGEADYIPSSGPYTTPRIFESPNRSPGSGQVGSLVNRRLSNARALDRMINAPSTGGTNGSNDSSQHQPAANETRAETAARVGRQIQDMLHPQNGTSDSDDASPSNASDGAHSSREAQPEASELLQESAARSQRLHIYDDGQPPDDQPQTPADVSRRRRARHMTAGLNTAPSRLQHGYRLRSLARRSPRSRNGPAPDVSPLSHLYSRSSRTPAAASSTRDQSPVSPSSRRHGVREALVSGRLRSRHGRR